MEHQSSSVKLDVSSIAFEYYEERNELLHQLIEKLLKFLPPNYRKRVDQIWQQVCTGGTSANDSRAVEDETLVIENVADSPYGEVVAVSSMMALRLAFYNHFRVIGNAGLLLPEGSLERDVTYNSESKHKTGWYRPDKGTQEHLQTMPIQVLIERVYCPSIITMQSSEERTTRIGALAELLHHEPKPKDFRVLDCLASSAQVGTRALTFFTNFRRLLEAVQNLSLEVLMSCSKVEYLNLPSKSGNIGPSNILFFVLDVAKPRIIWEAPYLVNFSHSRPDGNVWTTDGPAPERDYQHPEYLMDEDPRPRFKPQYDCYSMGVVLLEVGLWQPVIEMLRGKGGSPAELRNTLLQEYVPRLRRNIGKRYRNATRECLKGIHLEKV
ncbi:MAG: hypothetical protein Q9167_000460 [Letrouitia subvulpina]